MTDRITDEMLDAACASFQRHRPDPTNPMPTGITMRAALTAAIAVIAAHQPSREEFRVALLAYADAFRADLTAMINDTLHESTTGDKITKLGLLIERALVGGGQG